MLVCLPADTHLEERIERGQRKEAFEECHHALQGIIDGVHRRAEEQLQHGLRILARVIIRTLLNNALQGITYALVLLHNEMLSYSCRGQSIDCRGAKNAGVKGGGKVDH